MPWWSGDIRDFSEEEFHGYFGDIRSVAVRTLPRRPPKELLALLNSDIHGIPEPGRPGELVLASPVKSGGVYVHGRPNPAYSFYDFDWDLPVAQGTGEFSYHPSNSNTESQHGNGRGNAPKKRSTCSQVEKTMLAISGYLAVAILILIIIVGVLVVSLQNLDNNIDELKSVSLILNYNHREQGGFLIAAPLLRARSKNNESTTITSFSPTTIKQRTTKPTTTTMGSIISTTPISTPQSTTPKTTPKPTTTTPKPTTTTPKPTTTTPKPTTTTPKPTTTPTTTLKPTTTTLKPTTTTPKPTTTTPKPTTTTPKPTTTTPKPTTTAPKPTTPPKPTPKPMTTTLKPTTPKPMATTPKPTTTTPKPTTTTPKPTTTTPKPTTTTPKPTTTTPKPTTTTPKPTTTTPKPTTTTPKPTTTTPKPTTTTPQPSTTEAPMTTKGPETCDSQYCSSLAYDMLGRINSTIDPCVDFYQYACGSWITSRQTLLNAKVLEPYRATIESDKQTIIHRKLRVTKDIVQTLQTLFFSRDTLSSFTRPAEMQFVGVSQMGSPSLYNYDVVADIISGTKLFALQANISFRKSTLSPTTQTADTPKPKLVDAPREMGIFIVIGGVFLSILVIIIYFKRRQNISYTKERVRIQSSDTESVLWTSSEGGEYHHRNVLMIAVSEGISQEVDEILRLIRANSSLEVTFHEETMKEVALNENDWIDIQFKRADYAIVVLSESLFVESAIASFTEKLLRRLESETIIGGVSYTAICFDGPNTWNLLNRMKTAHRLLTFPTAFTFTDITTRPLDNRNKHTMATLVESIKQREDISYK
ncbi:hypothetical protein FSP39_018371 [Pinctada imbricata]|uniref:Uncharacterized protein n=1 Tax=Pinctada imbricata TaxID=66713 RepID=A0AA89C295_PINIB|nr:hypothetical protein FSP39_018371 [Pinctada imbricata]